MHSCVDIHVFLQESDIRIYVAAMYSYHARALVCEVSQSMFTDCNTIRARTSMIYLTHQLTMFEVNRTMH